MQNWLLISLVVLASTLLWPLNRWAMRNHARTEALGIVITLTVIVLCGALAMFTDSRLLSGPALLLGVIGGMAYAVGFVLIIFHCLKIGPTGPTVTLNNLGLVWPVVAGMAWFATTRGSAMLWLGFGCTLLTLVLTGVNRSRGEATAPITARWASLALVGWALSGISMTSQFLDSRLAPNTHYAYLLAMNATALVICLAVLAVKRGGPLTRVEITAGLGNGALNIVAIPLSIWLAGRMDPAVLFPVAVAGPVILMLLIGHFVLKERLNPLGWTASALGLAGIMLLSLSR